MLTECRIEVRYPDCDPMGIVHHAVYPIWYEIARMDYFAKIGFSYTDMSARGINPPMVNLNLQYNSPVRYPGSVTVRTTCSLCAGKKLELRYAVYPDGQNTPAATATSFHIWTGPDMKSLDMRTLPEVYDKLAGGVARPAVLILSGEENACEAGLEHAAALWNRVLPDARLYVCTGGNLSSTSLPIGAVRITGTRPGQGLNSVLRAAFEQTDEELFAVSDMDLPLMTDEMLRLLLEKRTWCEDLCVFQRGGKPELLPGLYRRTLLSQLTAMADTGASGAEDLLRQSKATLVKLKDQHS